MPSSRQKKKNILYQEINYKMNRLSKILIGTAAVLSVGVMGEYYFNKYLERAEFKKVYQESLIEADTNHDGKLSLDERNEFKKNLFANTGILFHNSDRMIYENGKEVPIKRATELLRGYNLKK